MSETRWRREGGRAAAAANEFFRSIDRSTDGVANGSAILVAGDADASPSGASSARANDSSRPSSTWIFCKTSTKFARGASRKTPARARRATHLFHARGVDEVVRLGHGFRGGDARPSRRDLLRERPRLEKLIVIQRHALAQRHLLLHVVALRPGRRRLPRATRHRIRSRDAIVPRLEVRSISPPPRRFRAVATTRARRKRRGKKTQASHARDRRKASGAGAFERAEVLERAARDGERDAERSRRSRGSSRRRAGASGAFSSAVSIL